MNLSEFGLYMARLREEAGYESQAALGKASGVSNSTIARIEDGHTKNPDPVTLVKLAPYLKKSVNDLMIAAGYLDPTSLPPSSNDLKSSDESDYNLPQPGEIPDELIPKLTKLIKQNIDSLTDIEKEYLYNMTKLTIEAIANRNKKNEG